MHAAIAAIGLALISYAPGDALAERVAAYKKAEGVEARCAALDAVAQLAKAPDGPGAEAVARALGPATRDEILLVRAHAVELLAGNDALDTALAELMRATRTHVDLEREIHERMRSMVPGKLPEFCVKDRRGRDIVNPEVGPALEQWKKDVDALAQYVASVQDHPRVREALTAAFVRIADDRSVDGLDLLLESAGHGAMADLVVDALLGYATVPALDRVIEHLARYEAAAKSREKERSKLASSKPRAKPSGVYADEVWERLERQRLEKGLSDFDARAAEADLWIASLCVKLREFGAAHGLGGAPSQPLPARAWRDWAAKSRGLLPASLAPAPPPKDG